MANRSSTVEKECENVIPFLLINKTRFSNKMTPNDL